MKKNFPPVILFLVLSTGISAGIVPLPEVIQPHYISVGAAVFPNPLHSKVFLIHYEWISGVLKMDIEK